MNVWVTLVTAAAGHAINAGIVGVVFTAALWLGMRAFRSQSSRSRFAIWFVGLLAIATLPFLLAQRSAAGASGTTLALPSAWAVYCVAIWAAGAVINFARLGSGLVRLRQLRKRAARIPQDELPATVVEKLNHRGVGLYRSEDVAVPMVIGFLRPAILLPSSLISQLSHEELDVIVLHEMAHVRRCDDWTNLVQKIVKAVFFFHPAVWWIDGRLALEREMACDEIVLEQSPSAKAYAGFLISFHEKMQNAGAPALVQALVSRVSQLSARVTEILDGNKVRRRGRVPMIAATAAVLASVAAAPMLPDVVSFRTAPVVATRGTHSRHSASARGHETLVPDPAPQAKAINAAYHSNAPAPAPAAKAKVMRKTRLAQAKAPEPAATPRATLVVYHAAQFDGANWTICVWSVDPATNKTVEAIVFKI